MTNHEEMTHYQRRAKEMNYTELEHSIAEIDHLLTNNWKRVGTSHPYVRKLYNEFDAYTVERNRRLADR